MEEIQSLKLSKISQSRCLKNSDVPKRNISDRTSYSNLNGMNILGIYNKSNIVKNVSFKGDLKTDEDLSDILNFLEQMNILIEDLDNTTAEKQGEVASDVYKTESDWQDRLKKLDNICELNEVNFSDIQRLMMNFFANTQNIEQIIKETDFTIFGKEGIPLEYSRKDFIDDLNNLLSDVSDKSLIIDKLGICPIYDKDGQITGYDGMLDYSQLNRANEDEENIYQIVHRYIKENKVVTNDKRLNVLLTSLINGIPEFINIIGKKQHEQQEYTLDVHTLSVLQKAMTHPYYETLKDIDKTILKWSAIMHDISKKENVRDYNHADSSAQISRKIMERYTLPLSVKDRIYNQIKNHHWLAEYNNGYLKPEEVAVIFRHEGDIDIARIITEADIKSIDREGRYWRDFSSALDTEKQQLVDKAKDEQDKTGQLLYISKIVSPQNIPQIRYQGELYKVIDLPNISEKQLSEIYTPGTKKDDLRYCVNVVNDDDSAIGKFEMLYSLGDIASDNEISASYISLRNKKTLNDYKFGVSVEALTKDISNAYKRNQYSGTYKNMSDFIRQIQANSDTFSEYRATIPSIIKRELELSDEEYTKLFKMLSENRNLSRIYTNGTNPHTGKLVYINKEFNINGKVLKGEDILKAIRKACDEILDKTIDFNEICMYKPQTTAFIAKVDGIEEIPEKYLGFVRKYGLPIILLGRQ